ncbi:MAG: hypothetical protein R3B49_07785 [Phycisphaerales bacterium]
MNDAPEHAAQLAEWLRPFTRDDTRGHIGLLNVIPYNPRRNSPWPAPDEDRHAFRRPVARTDTGPATPHQGVPDGCPGNGIAEHPQAEHVPAEPA